MLECCWTLGGNKAGVVSLGPLGVNQTGYAVENIAYQLREDR